MKPRLRSSPQVNQHASSTRAVPSIGSHGEHCQREKPRFIWSKTLEKKPLSRKNPQGTDIKAIKRILVGLPHAKPTNAMNARTILKSMGQDRTAGGIRPSLANGEEHIMTKLIASLLLAMCIFSSGPAFAAKVYATKYRSNAEHTVYVTKNKSNANCIVYRASYASGSGSGAWFFTKNKSNADTTIHFVSYASGADLKVFFTKTRSEAKCWL